MPPLGDVELIDPAIGEQRDQLLDEPDNLILGTGLHGVAGDELDFRHLCPFSGW